MSEREPSRPIYQHPLAYLLGLEGIALMRGFCGEFGREFTLARLTEVRELLDSADRLGGGVCGTGRHAEYLAGLGHTVTGVDSSPDMLAVARAKVPVATFLERALTALPLPDRSTDLVVCGIALNHLDQLEPAYREFVRVLRPGGHLVVSDAHGLAGELGLPVVTTTPDGRAGYMPARRWRASDHLAAALPLGLAVRRCEEPRRPSQIVSADGSDPHIGEPSPAHEPGAPPDVWALHPLVIDAANAAWGGNPIATIWHLELAG